MMERLQSLELKMEARQKLQGLKNDMVRFVACVLLLSTRQPLPPQPSTLHFLLSQQLVLKNIWFNRIQDTDCHAARLEQFYKQQAHACELAAAGKGGKHSQVARTAPRGARGAAHPLQHGPTAQTSLPPPTLPPTQTMPSAPASCGAASRCWRRARRGCATPATTTWWGLVGAAAMPADCAADACRPCPAFATTPPALPHPPATAAGVGGPGRRHQRECGADGRLHRPLPLQQNLRGGPLRIAVPAGRYCEGRGRAGGWPWKLCAFRLARFSHACGPSAQPPPLQAPAATARCLPIPPAGAQEGGGAGVEQRGGGGGRRMPLGTA